VIGRSETWDYHHSVGNLSVIKLYLLYCYREQLSKDRLPCLLTKGSGAVKPCSSDKELVRMRVYLCKDVEACIGEDLIESIEDWMVDGHWRSTSLKRAPALDWVMMLLL